MRIPALSQVVIPALLTVALLLRASSALTFQVAVVQGIIPRVVTMMMFIGLTAAAIARIRHLIVIILQEQCAVRISTGILFARA
jgi:hypothetical protein